MPNNISNPISQKMIGARFITNSQGAHIANNSDYEPQRTNNFELQITGLDELIDPKTGKAFDKDVANTITISVKSVDLPVVNQEVLKFRVGNTEVKFAGAPTFSDSSVVFRDFIGKDTERILDAWKSLAFNMRTQQVGLASNYKKIAYLIEYAPDYSVYKSWTLYGCWLNNLEPQGFDYDENGLRLINGQLVVDYAILDEDSPSLK